MATALPTPRLTVAAPLPAGTAAGTPPTGGAERRRTSFTAWNAPVEIELTGPDTLLRGASALVKRLEHQWDPTFPNSDLHRMAAMVGTMVTVEPETVALVELAVRAARKRSDASAALHDIVIDNRRYRVGLPADGLLDLPGMVPALTASLLVRYLQENGASQVRVRVAEIVREARRHAVAA